MPQREILNAMSEYLDAVTSACNSLMPQQKAQGRSLDYSYGKGRREAAEGLKRELYEVSIGESTVVSLINFHRGMYSIEVQGIAIQQAKWNKARHPEEKARLAVGYHVRVGHKDVLEETAQYINQLVAEHTPNK